MKSLVDQHGKPFTPSPFAAISKLVSKFAASALLEAAKPSKMEINSRVAQLRESCGMPLPTITFRRSIP